MHKYQSAFASDNKRHVARGLRAAWSRAHDCLLQRAENPGLPFALREFWVPDVHEYCSRFRTFLIAQAQGAPAYSRHLLNLANKPIDGKIFGGLSPFGLIVHFPTAESLIFAKVAIASEMPLALNAYVCQMK